MWMECSKLKNFDLEGDRRLVEGEGLEEIYGQRIFTGESSEATNVQGIVK